MDAPSTSALGKTCAAALVALVLTGAPRLAAAQDHPEPGPKSGRVATSLAIGTTLAGVALMAIGGDSDSEPLAFVGAGLTTIGPSAGHIYAGEGAHAATSSLIRAGAIGIAGIGVGMSFCIFDCEDVDIDQRRAGTMIAFVGVGLFAAATIYDVVDAHQAADRANRRAADLAASPAIIRSPDGARAPGMVLTGRF